MLALIKVATSGEECVFPPTGRWFVPSKARCALTPLLSILQCHYLATRDRVHWSGCDTKEKISDCRHELHSIYVTPTAATGFVGAQWPWTKIYSRRPRERIPPFCRVIQYDFSVKNVVLPATSELLFNLIFSYSILNSNIFLHLHTVQLGMSYKFLMAELFWQISPLLPFMKALKYHSYIPPLKYIQSNAHLFKFLLYL